jgi:hypothetical protein
MKTRKALSIVLAVVMAFGVFAVAGAAQTAQPLMTANAIWPSQVTLSNSSQAWDNAIINWPMFRGTSDALGYNDNGFNAQRIAGTAEAEWRVYADGQRLTIHPNFPQASGYVPAPGVPGLQIHRHRTNTMEQLHIRQGPTRWYGVLRIELHVTANITAAVNNGQPHTGMGVFEISLMNLAGLQNAIRDAEAMVANRNRYNDAYIRELERLLTVARWHMTNDMSHASEAVEMAEANLRAHIALGNQNFFFLLDNGFFNAIAPTVWTLVDLVGAVADFLGPLFNVIGTILNFLRIFLPI